MAETDDTGRITLLLGAYADMPGGLLPALREAQFQIGYIPRDSLPAFADVFNLSNAEVYGVVTFYDDLVLDPPASVQIRLCRAEACRAVGSEVLAEHIESTCNARFGSRSADDAFGLRNVFCFGNCAAGPTLEIQGRLIGRANKKKFDAAMAVYRPLDASASASDSQADDQ